jgi:hypothetical protein
MNTELETKLHEWVAKLSRLGVSMCPEITQDEAKDLVKLLVDLKESAYSEFERGYDECYAQFVDNGN